MAYLDINWEDNLICAYSQNDNLVIMVYREIDDIPSFEDLVLSCHEYNDQKILDILLDTTDISSEYEAEQLTEEIFESLVDEGYFDDFDKYIYEIVKKHSLLVVFKNLEEYSEFLQIDDSDDFIIAGEAQNLLLPKFSVNGITSMQGYSILQCGKMLGLERGTNE